MNEEHATLRARANELKQRSGKLHEEFFELFKREYAPRMIELARQQKTIEEIYGLLPSSDDRQDVEHEAFMDALADTLSPGGNYDSSNVQQRWAQFPRV